MRVVWICEAEIFGDDGNDIVATAARALGSEVRPWRDDYWERESWPRLDERVVLFRGALDNAKELPWSPGSLCSTERFHCSAYYPRAEPWLLQRPWRRTTVAELCAAQEEIAEEFRANELFVRPDSPLKPFAGRVVAMDTLTPETLDCGFYHDDDSLPVIVAPRRQVEAEWRFVVVEGAVVAGSAYQADGRRAAASVTPADAPWRFAEEIAEGLEPPEAVYVLDVCRAERAFWLLELNPFSGADLYGCDGAAVVRAVEQWAARTSGCRAPSTKRG